MTAAERQREREEKRRRRQERAKEREKKQRERERREPRGRGEGLRGLVLTDDDRHLLERWTKMRDGAPPRPQPPPRPPAPPPPCPPPPPETWPGPEVWSEPPTAPLPADPDVATVTQQLSKSQVRLPGCPLLAGGTQVCPSSGHRVVLTIATVLSVGGGPAAPRLFGDPQGKRGRLRGGLRPGGVPQPILGHGGGHQGQVREGTTSPGWVVFWGGTGFSGWGVGFLGGGGDRAEDTPPPRRSQGDSAPLSASLLADWLEVHRLSPAALESLQRDLQLGSPMLLADDLPEP